MADNQDFSGILGGPSAGAVSPGGNQDFTGLSPQPVRQQPARPSAPISVTADTFDSITDPQQKKNLQSYLGAIGASEGADYNTIVGGKKFDDTSRHPGIVGLTTKDGPSTAAGRYQITKTTYDDMASKLGITDFSPASQDRIAVALLQRRGALDDVLNGRFNDATGKLGDEWQSLPSGTSKNQGKRTQAFFDNALAMASGASSAQAAEVPTAPVTNAPRWQDLSAKPEFQKFTPAEKQMARVEYFNRFVAPGLKPNEVKASKEWFLAESVKHDGKTPSMVANVVDGLGKMGGMISGALSGNGEAIPTSNADPMTGIDPTAGIAPAPAADPRLAGSVMANVPQGTGSTTPASVEFRDQVTRAYNAATPAQRIEMGKRPDVVGQLVAGLNKQYGTEAPTTGLLSQIDPRAEARAVRLAGQGMDVKLADDQARFSASMGAPPGDEIGTATKSNFDFDTFKRYKEDPFYANPLIRGAVKGYEGFKVGALGVNQFVGDMTGADEYSYAMAGTAKQSKNFTDAMGEGSGALQRNFEGAISSIAQQLPALIGGVVTGSEGMVLGAMFMQSFGQEYAEGRGKGQTTGEATTRASLFASFEVIGEKFGLKFQLDAMRKASQGVTTDLLSGWLANTIKKELPGELLTTTGQFLTDKLPGNVGQNTEAGWSQYLNQMSDTVTQTLMQSALMGGGVGGVGNAVKYAKGRGQSDSLQTNVANAAQENALSAWTNNGLSPSRVEPTIGATTAPASNPTGRIDPTMQPVAPTPDAFSAGLTPEQRAVDDAARMALEPLTLNADETPVSMLRGTVVEDAPVPTTVPTSSVTAEERAKLRNPITKPAAPVTPATTTQEQNVDQATETVKTETQGSEAPSASAGVTTTTAAEATSEFDLQETAAPTGAPAAPRTEKTVRAKKAQTGAATARDKLKAENPFLSFLATQGVSIQDRADVGGQKGRAGMVLIPGHGPLFRKNAPRLDILATLAHEAGFLTTAQLEDVNDNGGVNVLSEMIQRAANKEIVQTSGMAEGMTQDDLLMQEANAAGIDTTGKTPDQVYDLVRENYDQADATTSLASEDVGDAQEASSTIQSIPDEDFGLVFKSESTDTATNMRALGFTEQEIKDALNEEQSRNTQGNNGTQQTQASVTRGSDSQRGNTQGSDSFGLQGETNAEIVAKEKATEKTKAAEKKAQQEADDKAKVDAESGGFTLTGSDRVADTAAAAGQKDLLAEPVVAPTAPTTTSEADLSSMFDDIAAEEAPAVTPPRTEAQAKAKKPTGKKADAERARQRADYFTPGNVVKGYGGMDRVVDYQAETDRGGFAVTVERVVMRDGQWVATEAPRRHSTDPTPKELAAGPEFRAVPAQTANSPRTNSLSRTASWVIKERATGIVMMETSDKRKVDALNTAKYEAVPIAEHLASLSTPPRTERQATTQRTATASAASAAKNAATAAANAIDGLGALFGGNGTLGSGPVFNEETYAKAKPLFQAAVTNLQTAGTDIRDVIRAIIRMVQDKFGAGAVANMKPYVIRFAQDFEASNNEGQNEPTTGKSAEQNSADNQPEAPVDPSTVQTDAAGTGRPGQLTSEVTGERESGPTADNTVPGTSTDAVRTGRDNPISEQNGELGLAGDVAQSSNAERSSGNSDERTDAGPSATESLARDDAKADVTFAEKVALQKAAGNVTYKAGDRANIDASLPLLMPSQRQDVHFAENRLMKPEGYGVVFTNGTGTGKTYLGLGVVQRMIQSGKKNGLIIVPNEAVINEWIPSARNMGIDLHLLESTTDKGRGVSITTYANLANNLTLADRAHDFVVADEAHSLMSNAQAADTSALTSLRAITMHPDSAIARSKMVDRALYDQLAAARELMGTLEAEATAQGKASTPESWKAGDDFRAVLKQVDASVKAQKALIDAAQGTNRPRALFLSATPFAYEQNVQWANGYLFDYPKVKETGAYNEPSPYGRFMIQHFGWRMRTGKLNEPDAKVDRGLMQRQFNSWMRKQGVLSSRILDVESDYDRKFILVDGGVGAQIDRALDWLRTTRGGLYRQFYDVANDQFDYLSRSRLLEAIKAKAAIPYIKAQHALGRKVVVFYDFNEGGGFSPFDFKGSRSAIIKSAVHNGTDYAEASFQYGEFIDEFQAQFPALYGKAFADVMSPLDTLTAAFPSAGVYNGQSQHAKTRGQSIKNFNLDELPDSNLLLVQSAANAGWSGHDTTGKNQRVLLNLGLPVAPTKAIQQEGRIYRIGQKSDAIFRYMNTGTVFERTAFATKVARRASTAENLAMGEQARGLLQVFIDAFQNSDTYTPSTDEGKGGKVTDRAALAEMTDFDRAKSFYFGQQKKTARNKAAEGVDYFATPEPLGLKMVEWLSLQPGESVLEPSAGHGAIARWFPEAARRTVVEPSLELASRLALLTDAKMVNDSFESLNIINKFDGIAMNPPFGTGGKLAMEHIAKAFGHLNDGGRIVAIVPAGPAMTKRLDQWLYGVTVNAKGESIPNNPQARLVSVIALPSSTFGRAGTGVMTHVFIIDRDTSKNKIDYQGDSDQDLSNVGDINKLFDAIQNISAPARITPVTPVAPPAPAASVSTEGKIVTDAPMVEYTTNAGKVRQGVYIADKAAAMAVDPFTFKPRGAPGYFVRMRHVVRPGALNTTTTTSTLTRFSELATAGSPTEMMQQAVSLVGLNRDVKVVERTDMPLGIPMRYDPVSGTIEVAASWELTPAQSLQMMVEEVLHSVDAQHRPVAGETTLISASSPRFNMKTGDIAIEAQAAFDGSKSSAVRDFLKYPLHPDNKLSVQRTQAELFARLGVMYFGDPQLMQSTLPIAYEAYHAIFGRVSETNARLLRNVRGDTTGIREAGIQPELSQGNGRSLYQGGGRQTENKLGRLRAAVAASLETTQQGVVFKEGGPLETRTFQEKVKPKLGLLDTPMRLLFQKTGAINVWRGAFRVLEKVTGAALNNKFGEVIKAGLIDRYGLSDAVIERHEDMRIEMIKGVRTTQRFLDRMKGLTRIEYATLYAAANNADRATVEAMIKDLPEDSQAALHEIKELVRDLGQQAVELKMLDADIFKRNEWAYLHRSYLKHEVEMLDGEKTNRATRIKGDQFKQRGLADIVTAEKLLKWMPEFWGTRVKNGVINNAIIGQTFTRYERRDDVSPTPNLPGIEGAPALGRLKEVVYWPDDQPTPAKYADWVTEGNWEARRVVGGSVVFRRDFSAAERVRMGEIDDIRYGMAKTLNLAIHDVEVGKYFEWLADTSARLPGEMAAGDNVIDDARQAESRFQAFTRDSWVLVPETKIKGTQVSAYGKLAGRYIPGPVWVDIRNVNNAAFFNGSVGKTYEKLLRLWKISKTALSPAVHVNNVMANVVMADWHEVSGPQLLTALQVWATQGKNAESRQLVQDFQDNGGELGNYALTELQRGQLDPILEELIGKSRNDNNLNGIVNAGQVFSLMRQGMLKQAAATFGQSKVTRGAAAVPQKMIDIYQLEDQVFRLAAFIKARKSGLSDRAAGRYARRSFLDYNITAPWVVAAKQSGLLPFISFSYRAIPMLYETIRDKPWKILKLGITIGTVNAASAAFLGLSPDDEDDERRWLPKEKQGKIFGLVPKMVRMPWNSKDGNPVFLDIRRFIPAGDITDTGMSHGALPLPGFLSTGGMIALFAELMTNKSMFTGNPIVLDTDTGVETATKVLDYVYKWAAPNIPLPSLGTILPGTESGQFQTYSWTGIQNAYNRQEGTFGRDQNLPEAIGSSFGIKLEGYDPAVGQTYAQFDLAARMRELSKQQSSLQRQFGKGGIDEKEFTRRMDALEEKKAAEQTKMAERFDKKSPGLSDLMPRK